MADNLITLQMIAKEYIHMTGAKKATASFLYDIKKDLRSLSIDDGISQLVSYGINDYTLSMSLDDFMRLIVGPLLKMKEEGIINPREDIDSLEVIDSVTERLADG